MQGSDIINLYLGSALIILFVIVGVVILIILYQRKLFAQKESLNQLALEHEKELNRSIIENQERERSRIARDLHDDLGSLLSAIRLQVLMLQKQVPALHNQLEETANSLQEGIQSVRNISQDLLPVTLTSVGLIPTIEELCDKINQTGLTTKFETQGEFSFSSTEELALYRVIQELINNTIRHADAKQINILFQDEQYDVVIDYQDDGKGLSTQYKPGLGLKNIESRISFINGQVRFNPNKEGFSITFLLPKHN